MSIIIIARGRIQLVELNSCVDYHEEHSSNDIALFLHDEVSDKLFYVNCAEFVLSSKAFIPCRLQISILQSCA